MVREPAVLLLCFYSRGVAWPPQVDEYFERETVDTSTIDTLAEVLPLGNLSDAAAVAEALARTAALAAAAEEEEKGCLLPPPPAGVPAAAVVLPGAGASVGAVAGLAEGLVQLPGQRALLRLRKKCDAGAGE